MCCHKHGCYFLLALCQKIVVCSDLAQLLKCCCTNSHRENSQSIFFLYVTKQSHGNVYWKLGKTIRIQKGTCPSLGKEGFSENQNTGILLKLHQGRSLSFEHVGFFVGFDLCVMRKVGLGSRTAFPFSAQSSSLLRCGRSVECVSTNLVI